jgi:hypothetical protein
MATTALKQEWIAGIAVPIATLAVVGFAVAQPAVGDNALALLRDGFAFVSTLHIGGGFSPAVASAIAVVLFLAGVVSGLSGFAFSAVAACVLWLLPPLQAVPLIMLLSACNQLLSVGTLRKEMVLRGTAEREGALAYIAGGLVGVPIGLVALQALPTRSSPAGSASFSSSTARSSCSSPTLCGSSCRVGSRRWPWALREASSADFPLSQGRYR